MRGSGNASVEPGEGSIVSGGGRARQLALYDALPREFRLLVDSAPIEQDVAEVWVVIEQRGAGAAWEAIASLWENTFPGWRRPER